MKPLLSIKTLFRTPLKTLLTFLLLGVTSYMLFFGVAEYAAVSRAMEQAVGFYQGIGAVEAEPPLRQIPDGFWPDSTRPEIQRAASVYSLDFYLYADERVAYNPYGEEIKQYSYAGLSQSSIDAIAALPHVSRASVRYMTAGVSASLKRSFDIDEYYKYSARFVAEATLYSFFQYPQEPGQVKSATYNLQFTDFNVLAGDQEPFEFFHGDDRRLAEITAKAFYPGYAVGGTYPDLTWSTNKTLVRIVIHGSEAYRSEVYSTDYLDSLVPGERYAIIGRYTPVYMGGVMGDTDMSLSDPMTLDWCPQLYPLKDLPENYLDLPEFAPLREMIELTDADSHTLDVVYTDDMSAIMRFAEGSMQLTDGRMLTIDDSENRNNVCVMNSRYMSENGLEIGDRITLMLGDELFEQNQSLGAVAVVRERYPGVLTKQEFEIVGAYRDVDTMAKQTENLHWAYSRNTVFVPLPFLPVEVPDDHVVKPGEFSFIIGDPRDISAFLEEALPVIEGELGLTLFFSDGGWSVIESQIGQAGASASVRLAASSLSVAAAVCLTAYLFIWRKRKEYAVMRALGTTRPVANRSLYVPLAVLGLSSTAVGTALGRLTAGSRIKNVLAPFTDAGIDTVAVIPGYLVLVCFVLALAALAIFTALMLRRTGSKPPLELLQAGEGMGAAKKGERRFRYNNARIKAPDMENRAVDLDQGAGVETATPRLATKSPARARRKQGPVRNAARYAARHICRSPIKSLLFAGLALLLAGAVGQLTVVRGAYREIYRNIDQKAYIINGITLQDAIESTAFSGLLTVYFEDANPAIVCYHSTPIVVITNDIARYSGGAAEIEFLDGYGYASQNTVDQMYGPANKTCVMDAELMRELGLELGDTVRFTDGYEYAALYREHFGLPPLDMDPKELRKNQESIDPLYDKISVFFTVVGREVSGSAPDTVYVPVTGGIEAAITRPTHQIMDYAEYTLTSPEHAGAFRSFIESKIEGPAVGDVGSPFMMDTGEADNILQRVKLLDALYPIAVSIAVVLSGLFPGLSVMQTDREAAIMRALGETKKRARSKLVIVQAALCAIGLLCAAIMLAAANGATVTAYAWDIVIFAAAQLAACIAGALICAVVTTRRRVLELLQVKE